MNSEEIIHSTTVTSLSGEGWLLATDPQNVGKNESWFKAPRREARKTRIPWTIQAVFPGYIGAAWYWRELDMPANPHENGRYLLRFWDVDYLADVWVNGKHLGSHEGAQGRFILDATEAVNPGVKNVIAVRVLAVFGGPVEGIIRSQTPHGGSRDLNLGGIIDEVELIVAPEVRVDDVFVRADPDTGMVRVEASVWSEANKPVSLRTLFVVAPATSGEPVCEAEVSQEVKPGANTVIGNLKVPHPRLWDIKSPILYRLDTRARVAGSYSVSETSTRFGFRDFRFENGCYRLNGRRVFWTSAHTGADTPITICVPIDPEFLRKDLINLKEAGFTGIRFISMLGKRYQLDMADELGLMVYEESYASWMLAASDKLAERMDRSLTDMVLRDRNHPSVVMWGLLNETGAGPVFDHALASLPLMRRLDDTRLIMLGSGRSDATNVLNGLEIWKPEAGFAPCLAFNPKIHAISVITLFRSSEASVTPGVNGEYAVARWTAPTDGAYVVSAKFRGTGMFTTTDVHVLIAGKPVFDGFINQQGRGDRQAWSGKVQLVKGETLDFVVGGRTPAKGEWYEKWGHNTSLDVKISGCGVKADLAAEFSKAANPNGAWSYGLLAPGLTPVAATFKPFARCDTESNTSPGSLSNPGSSQWEDLLGDQHYYPRVPHRELEIARLRSIAINGKPHLLSEYGIGSGVDYTRFLRQCEQYGYEGAERYDAMKGALDTFLADWNRLKLEDTFASPEDFFRQCVAREAEMKTMGINALRSNPNLVGYGMTGLNDPLEYGEGFITNFRELKPGVTDAIFDGFYPVRWCTFAEPVNAYRGSKVLLEAVLSNQDAARPGQYPARVQVIGPDGRQVMDRTIAVTIPERPAGKEPPFAIPVFKEEVPIDGPSGKYRFLVTFQKGVAATGGEAVFYIADPADMPAVDTEVVLWGDDPELADWLADHEISARRYVPTANRRPQTGTREVILVSNAPGGGGTDEAWRDLLARIAQGSTAIFLCHDVFAKDGNPTARLPLANKGRLDMVCEYWFPQVYPKDEWNRRHALFDGLPAGGLMDYIYYREMIPDWRIVAQDPPDLSVAGTFRTSCPGAYWCDSLLSVYSFGAGRFILNCLRVREELGSDPTAERLLRNMLRFATTDAGKEATSLPTDWAERRFAAAAVNWPRAPVCG